jgi:signal transduction histidine kinase
VLIRARIMLSLQLAGAITAVVLLVGSLAFMVTTNRQHALINDMLRYTLSQNRTGEVDPCAWLFVQRGDQLIGADAAPPGLPLTAPIRAAATDGTAASTSIRANGTRYFVRTERTDDGTRQAVFDARYQMSDRDDLLTALIVAELIGLLIASVTGVLLARLAIAPLDEALRRQRRFVADASHELRTPLTRLHTRAQLLLRRDLPPDIDDGLRRLVDSSRELNEIVDDLLRSAVLSAGRPTGTPVDLALVAETVVDAEQPRAAQEGIVLRTSYGPRATPAPAGVVPARVFPAAATSTVAATLPLADASTAVGGLLVAGVESALRRMVSALVDNALRHSFAGGRVTVTVALADRGRTVTLVVADDGTGLDPADGRRIFERFHRGTPERNGSHGLGLALVREIVEAHGGDVTATGRPGAGTDFVVRLPAYAASKPARRTA